MKTISADYLYFKRYKSLIWNANDFALVENKMSERKIDFKAVSVKPRSLLKIGNFQIEFIKVCHSIPGAVVYV